MITAQIRAGWFQINIALVLITILRGSVTIWLCLQALGCFDVAFASVPEPLILSEQQDQYSIFRHIEYLEDKTGKLSFSDVGPETNAPFVKVKTSADNFGISESAHWFRLSVTNTDPHQVQWWLEVRNTVLYWMEVYIIRSDTIAKHTLIKNGLTTSTGLIHVPSPVMRFDLHPGQTAQIYLRLESKGSISAPIFISRPEAFVANESQNWLWISLCYGFVITLLLYNLILFLSTRDINYLYYCFCIGSCMLLQAAMDDFLYVYIWPSTDGASNYPKTLLIAALTLVGMLQFSRHFLRGPEVFPKLNKFMRVYSVVMIAIFSLNWMVVELQPIALYLMSITVLGAFSLVIAGVALALYKGIAETKYFLIAWAFFSVGVIGFQLMLYGVLPTNFLTVRSIQIGSALEALLLSLALAHRMRALTQENNHILTESKVNLERQVHQRTLELNRALEELSNVNKLLVVRNVKAVKDNRNKSKFIAAASHSLRQHMQALGFYLRILRDRSPHDESLIKCQSAFTALELLLTSLLDISKLNASAITYTDFQHIAIKDIFERLHNANDHAARFKGLSLKFRSTPCTVFTDSPQLERILNNLITNAIRYTEQGGILVCGRRRKNHLLVQVWDTGPGIPEAEHKNIFRKFYQLDNKAKNQGLGLGLTIVKRLTSLLDIPLSLRSTLGRGTVFSLQVPYGRVTIPPSPPIGLPNTSINGRLTVMLIDDDAAIRDSMALLMESWGSIMVAAGSYREAMHVITEEHIVPDIIIVDYQLSENETGIELVKTIYSELQREVPTIIITGETSRTSINNIKAFGKPFIHKPVDPDKLKYIIKHQADMLNL